MRATVRKAPIARDVTVEFLPVIPRYETSCVKMGQRN
jgi:hypothetical protein